MDVLGLGKRQRTQEKSPREQAGLGAGELRVGTWTDEDLGTELMGQRNVRRGKARIQDPAHSHAT